ncbi:putative Cathepsin B [Blattamonas nauphoetae]|uniref:Cathepsin B n=1 Tax=Blattamonas nauphoetae TaxID=2049346 RepID=A0ABQ9XNA6_9EUKA|nr:putative Cathepsin B [Blattamonas nauphoetae]
MRPVILIGLLVLSCFSESFPSTYDVRTLYPECVSLNTPLNQGACGSCWAFSTTSASADHLCINRHSNEQMAAEHQIQCDTSSDACNGGYVSKALDFQVTDGLVPLSCKTYRDTSTRRCSQTCDSGTSIDSVKFTIKSKRTITSVEDAQKSIMDYGSLVAVYMVKESFDTFFDQAANAEKVYCPEDSHSGDQDITYHAIKIVGWTQANNSNNSLTDAWIVQNSWGSRWGNKGYFYIQRGVDAFEIESQMYQPEVEMVEDPCNTHLDCDSCHAAPKYTETGVDYQCRYCSTSDMCVSVKVSTTSNIALNAHLQRGHRYTNSGRRIVNNTDTEPTQTYTPRYGQCSEFAATCPLDDCLQMSHDPLRCVKHSGCGYCASSKKCKRGHMGKINSGICLDFKETKTELIRSFPCLDVPVSASDVGCKAREADGCVYCQSSGACLNSNPLDATKPLTGQCQQEHFSFTPTTVKCEDRANLLMCDAGSSSGCKWEAGDNKCVNSSSSAVTSNEGTQSLLQSRRARALQNTAAASLSKESECLQLDCDSCDRSAGCVWCHSTQSCIAFDSSANKTECTRCINQDTGLYSRCSQCTSYSSCDDCALDPECGWFVHMSLCMPGRQEPAVEAKAIDPAFENDTFYAYKLRCPIVLSDTSSWETKTFSGAHTVRSFTCTAVFFIFFVLCGIGL